jgi:hypothetical protein
MTEEHRRMPSFADEDLVDLRSYQTVEEGEAEPVELAPHETSLDFLQRVYRSVKQPMSRRLRAAIEALPHEHPRLGAIATASMNGQDFASLLERAIERSGKTPLMIEAAAQHPPEELREPMTRLRRF